MEYRTNRIIGVILAVIVLVIGVLIIGPLIGGYFNSNRDSSDVIQADRKSLLNTTYERAVRMTVRGPIVNDEDHNSYTVTVSSNNRSVTMYNGYLKQVTQTEEFDNNTAAYTEFVYALDNSGFIVSKKLTGDNNETRGICPSGYLYEFELLNSNKSVKKLWSTSCKRGSLNANVGIIKGMFINQIPDSSVIAGKLW